jgi:hypothetical protein
MNKKRLRYIYKQLRRIGYVPLITAILISALITVLSLRSNNQRMITLRTAVFVADEKNGDIEKALRELREYVYAHMNTDLSSGNNAVKPPIQLKFTYDRLVAAEKQRVSEQTSQIYVDAQVDCERRFPSGLSGSNRLPCIQEYVDSHGVTAKPIPDDLYKFDFASPSWSPDLAGWSLIATILLLVVFAIRLLSGLFIGYELKKHHH